MSINYEKLMAHNPTLITDGRFDVSYYEHPTHGDEAPLIAVHHGDKVAVHTDFFDTGDFSSPGDAVSDYDYILKGGELQCVFDCCDFVQGVGWVVA